MVAVEPKVCCRSRKPRCLAPCSAARVPPAPSKPQGFGYINATYYGRPKHKPTGCGDLSNDRTCGNPHAYDAIRYTATMEELVRPKVGRPARTSWTTGTGQAAR